MAELSPIRIATISNNSDPNWGWLRDLMGDDFAVAGRRLKWHSFSTEPENAMATAVGKMAARRLRSIGRFRGAQKLADAAREHAFDVIVSHGPWSTAWTESVLGGAKQSARHLAFSFNFTDLPTGARKLLMERAFRTVDAFAVFTDSEHRLYADYFRIDVGKLWRAPWGVASPLTTPPRREIEGEYFAALGGEARDYETLCEAARLCPDTRFVAIARPHNFKGLSSPENLSMRFNLPFAEAWGIVCHASATLIPLRCRETHCGLVTLVGTMHLGKAQIVTDAAGVREYIAHEESGLLVPARDPAAMAAAVRRLGADPALVGRLGSAARSHAETHCSEAATVRFFSEMLTHWFGQEFGRSVRSADLRAS